VIFVCPNGANVENANVPLRMLVKISSGRTDVPVAAEVAR
jgi:hypothetical protein